MFKGRVNVLSVQEIAEHIFDISLHAPEVANTASAGSFINLYLDDRSKLLPRPISICRTDSGQGTVNIVFRIAGEGTEQLSKLRTGDTVEIMGPLGNGFLPAKEKNAILFGGGIGIPPMLFLAKQLSEEGKNVISIMGYRNNSTFLSGAFGAFGKIHIATDDGSVGMFGNVIDAADKLIKKGGLPVEDACCYACGPIPMLKGVKSFADSHGIRAQISMEERMACGVGACLGCVVKTVKKDDHSNVNNKRVCKDGPVFWAEEIEL